MFKSYNIYATVFISGMAVMAIELTASRLLAPYFGASLFIWTNIIGVILFALSVGYYIGGKSADRRTPEGAEKLLYTLLLVTGVLITFIPAVGKFLFNLGYEAIPTYNVSVFLISFGVTLVLFTIPFIMLGMITPLAVKVQLKDMEHAGSTVGRLYAFSTVGSIIGTFIPVLFTIPFLGSRETFFLFGALLIIIGVFGLGRLKLLILAAIPLILSFTARPVHSDAALLFEDESIYNYVAVRQNPDGSKVLATNEGHGMQSLYYPDKVLTGFYWDAPLLLPLLNPQGKDFLIIGTAGGSSARALRHFFPYLNLAGIEIDPLIVKVAENFFDAKWLNMPITVADGRVGLALNPKKYDFMMIDVYRDELFIPFHLATEEFFTLTQNRLTEKGILIMNVASTSSSGPLTVLIKNTLAKVFPYTYELTSPDSYNTLLFGFMQKPDFSKIPTTIPGDLNSLYASATEGMRPVTFDATKKVATDNTSPVEVLTEKMLLSEVP